MSDKQQRNMHSDKNTPRSGQKEKLSPCTNQKLKNGLCERMTSVKQRGRMLYSNTPFQSHKMEVKRECHLSSSGGWLYSNTPFQSHKMEVKEGVPSIKQRGKMLYNNTPPKDYTRKDNVRTSQMHCTDYYTDYEHGTEELRMEDGLNAHMEQS